MGGHWWNMVLLAVGAAGRWRPMLADVSRRRSLLVSVARCCSMLLGFARRSSALPDCVRCCWVVLGVVRCCTIRCALIAVVDVGRCGAALLGAAYAPCGWALLLDVVWCSVVLRTMVDGGWCRVVVLHGFVLTEHARCCWCLLVFLGDCVDACWSLLSGVH